MELQRVLADPTLSLAAKGVLAFVLTRPPGAVVTRQELFTSNSDPIGVIDQALRELARGGYVATAPPAKRSASRQSGGVVVRQPTLEAVVFGTPVFQEPAVGRQRQGRR